MIDIDRLMDLIDSYAESRHINGNWLYNEKSFAARSAVIDACKSALSRIAELEAVGAGGVQALSAAPAVQAGWKLVPVEPTNDMQKAADEWAAKGFDWPKAIYRAMLAASPTPPAEQQATCTNSDSWNCKYCNKTKTCAALANAGQPPAPKEAPHFGPLRDTDAEYGKQLSVYNTPKAEQQATTTGAATPKGDATTGAALGAEPGAVYAEIIAGLRAVQSSFGASKPSFFDQPDRAHWDCIDAAIAAFSAQQAAPKAAPGELKDHQVLAITTAYEQGVGKGRQAHGSGKEIRNPYGPGYRCDLAWDFGYEEGKEQAKRMALAAPQQEAQEPATVPRFNCWSTNEGDSWFDHPADSQAIYDCLGNDAKVGDEYELTAGWKSVTARYRITDVVGDGEDYEVECISHPQENTAPQPAPAPLSRARVKEIMRENGYDGASAQHRADFINGIRHAEIAHGISAALSAQRGWNAG